MKPRSAALFLSSFVASAVACTPAPTTPPAPDGTVEVIEARGVDRERVGAALRPAIERMRRCTQGSGGKIVVRIEEVQGKLRFLIEPGASLDPTERACVLDALQTIELPETSSQIGGPSVPPSGFTSLVTIAW